MLASLCKFNDSLHRRIAMNECPHHIYNNTEGTVYYKERYLLDPSIYIH